MTMTSTGTGIRPERCPSAFTYWENKDKPEWVKRRKLFKRLTGKDLFPTDEQASALCEDLYAGDPVAEAFVDEVFFGDVGHKRGRAMVQQALEHGIDSVPDAPESMKTLFAEFEEVPDWVDPELVELGASVWKRWGTMLFSVAGVITLEIYTEGAVAMPLSLSGGYAGDNALRRFLETSRFWIDTSQPGALFEQGSPGRATAMQVRIMHVAVRRRVGEHAEWDADAWGLPICQTYEQMTQIGGSTVPALSLWLLGYQTTPKEIRALIHFNRYLGHLLGVQPRWAPETIIETLQTVMMTTAARSWDAGQAGKELIESFPAAFAPREGQQGLARLRARYNHGIYSAYTKLWMMPPTHKSYDLPRAFPWMLILLGRWPLVTVTELLRRLPGLKQAHVAVMDKHRESWWAAQMEGRQAEFDASSSLRR